MRAIKFRQMVKGKFHYWGFLEDRVFIGPADPTINSQQFTGLQDKNGMEIYEKNIFKSDDRVSPFVIVFHDGSFRGWYSQVATEPDPNSPGFHFDSYEASHGEVIGNSLQHSGLLKKE